MPRYKLTIEYDGRPFVGWQRQDNGASVQGALEDALSALERAPVAVFGAGRTDAGVHATGQVAHCDTLRDWEPDRLMGAVNFRLKGQPVAVLRVERAAADFHARFDAIERSYRYRIVCRRAPLTYDAGLVWRVPWPLDVDAMNLAAAPLLGLHDFTTFRSSQCQAKSPVKTLDELRAEQVGGEIHIHARARSFLHNQVRSFVGTLERVGAGKWPPARVAEALAARDRAACGPVCPPDGLYLTHVRYRSAAENPCPAPRAAL